MEKQGNGVTQGVIWKQLLIFFFPILFGTFFQQLYNTADAMIVGRFVGKEALAAVGGSTSILINLLVNLFVGLSSGATVIAAQYFGALQFEDVSRTVQTSIALAIVAGAGMTIVGFWIAPYALNWMWTPEELMDGAVTYLRVYFLGSIAAFIYNIGSAILRAIGDTRRPLYFLIVACLLNILLDVVFVVGMNLGVLGVALATLIAQVVSAALVIAALRRSDQFEKLTLRNIRFYSDILKGILRVGIPAGIQADMYSISNLILQTCINTFGTNVIAAWAITGKIDGFFWMMMGAFGVSITTFVGQNFGAGQYDRVKRSVKVCFLLALIGTVASSLFFWVFARPLFGLFGDDPEVIEVGIRILRMLSAFYITYICVEILSGAIRGVGDAFWPMIITCGGICVFRVLWVFLVLPLYWNLDMVMVSYPVSWTLTSVIFGIYYLHGGWLRKRIQHQKRSMEHETA